MKKKICVMLMATYLTAGCGGGGTSGGGGEGSVTVAGVRMTASLSTEDSFSHDVRQTFCLDLKGNVTGKEPNITTKSGTLTITAKDTTDLTGGLFPKHVALDRYTVSYAGGGRGSAPVIPPPDPYQKGFGLTVSETESTESTDVVLLSLEQIQGKKFRDGFLPPTEVERYDVTVTYHGRIESNTGASLGDFKISASTYLEVGNFDECG